MVNQTWQTNNRKPTSVTGGLNVAMKQQIESNGKLILTKKFGQHTLVLSAHFQRCDPVTLLELAKCWQEFVKQSKKVDGRVTSGDVLDLLKESGMLVKGVWIRDLTWSVTVAAD